MSLADLILDMLSQRCLNSRLHQLTFTIIFFEVSPNICGAPNTGESSTKRKTPIMDLPEEDKRDAPVYPSDLPSFPEPEDPLQLTCYVDAAHANDFRKRRSTTGYAFTLSGGVIAYRSKTQALTATSSTEAEFYAAVLAAKTALYLRSILLELGFEQNAPTPIYEDNEAAKNEFCCISPFLITSLILRIKNGCSCKEVIISTKELF